jgi:hypothetical protein
MKIVGKKFIGYTLGYTYYALGNNIFALLITHYYTQFLPLQHVLHGTHLN